MGLSCPLIPKSVAFFCTVRRTAVVFAEFGGNGSKRSPGWDCDVWLVPFRMVLVGDGVKVGIIGDFRVVGSSEGCWLPLSI